MKSLKLMTLLFLSLPWAHLHATKGAHGGVVVVCREPDGAVRSVELFDFWEWNRLMVEKPELQIKETLEPHKAQIQKALNKINQANPELGSLMATTYQSVSKVLTGLPMDVELPDLTDTDPVYKPKDCFLEQLASYDINPLTGEEALTVEPGIFSILSETQKAAFFLHETVYKVYRKNFSGLVYDRDGVDFKLGDTSRATRFFVGAVLSDLRFEPHSQAGGIQCRGEYFDFHIEAESLHLTRAGLPLPSAAVGQLEENGFIHVETHFNPLGGKINLEISTSENPLEYFVRSTGSMLNVRSDRVLCNQILKTKMRSLK